jgi:transposase
MTQIDNTLKAFGILDSNIKPFEIREERRGRAQLKTTVIYADLSYVLHKCPKCHAADGLHPNGHKLTHIKMPGITDRPMTLELNKQRWRCSACHHTTMATTPIVERNRSISRNIAEFVTKLSSQSLPESTIAKLAGISASSVDRIIHKTLAWKNAKTLANSSMF